MLAALRSGEGRRLGIGALAGVVAAGLFLTGLLDGLENKSWDARLRRLADADAVGDRVALLLVDQSSLDYMANEEGLSWPWPRELYVPALEYCRNAGARGVVFDILFTEPSLYGPEDDAALAAAIARKPDVVLPLLATANPPVGPLAAAAASLGNVLFSPDADGVFRRMPPRAPAAAGADAPWALPFAAYETFGIGTLEVEGRRIATAAGALPLDRNGEAIVRYRGPAGTVPSYSMASAIQSFVRAQMGEEVSLAPELLRDRVVFFGLSAPGLLDLRPTPVSAVYPGTEIHATALDNLWVHDFVRTSLRGWTVALCLLCATLLAYLSGRIRAVWKSAALLPLLIGLLVIGAVLALRAGVWLPLVAPVAAAALSFVAVQTVEFAAEGRQRRFLKHAFRHYLSPSVIEKMLEDPSQLKLGGERKELTIFFSDVAAFTELSEGLEAEALSQLLNRYLTEMTDVIHSEGGTVDKFEGDAIIAFWNAPLDQADHAARALRAGVRCLQRLDAINPELEKAVGRPLTMRVGIHSGPVVVGNMGSADRFDYTVIGDAANLASRLEGLGKQFASPIIVSEACWQQGGAALVGREIGCVRVVGRREATRLFQPLGLRDDHPLFAWWDPGDKTFADSLAAYVRGDMESAAAGFASLTDDPVARVYRARCESLAAADNATWDGVWNLEVK